MEKSKIPISYLKEAEKIANKRYGKKFKECCKKLQEAILKIVIAQMEKT